MTAHRTRSGRSAWTLLAVVVVGSTALTGCRGAEPAAAPAAPSLADAAVWTQAALPATASFSGERTSVTTALGTSASGLPEALFGVGSADGGVDQARVWVIDPGRGGWTWIELPAPGSGDETVGFAHDSGDLTWAGGWTTVPGQRSQPWLASSADRRDWKPVQLPAAATDAAFKPTAATSVGGSLLLAGTTKDSQAAVVTAGDEGSVVALPALTDGRELQAVRGAAALGRTVVVVAGASRPGGDDEVVVYRSEDGGGTWQVVTGAPTGTATANGVTTSGGSFVATGFAEGDGSVTHPAAWSSRDGVTWAAESVPDRSDDFAPGDGESGWLSAPSAAGDSVVAAYTLQSDLAVSSVRRDASGTWSLLALLDDWQAPGTDAVVAGHPDGSFSLTQDAYNAARLVGVAANGTIQSGQVPLGGITPGERLTFVDPSAGEGPVDVVGRRTTITTTSDGGWTQTGELSRYATGGTGDLAETDWQPSGSKDLAELEGATAEDGSGVLMGGRFTDVRGVGSVFNLYGWHRTSPDAEWQPATGLSGTTHDEVGAVVHTSAGWLAVGTSRASLSKTASHDSAAAWLSQDGTTWTRVPGTFDAPETEWGAALGACEAPGGGALVVGAQTEGGTYHPRAWRLADGAWTVLDTTVLGDDAGWLSSCATSGGSLLAEGTYAGRATLWSGTDAAALSRSELGARGDTFEAVTAVPGGFAAAGNHGADGFGGGVVWLSTDARTWVPVPVPTTRLLSATQVKVVGDRLAVVLQGPTGSELWYLDNAPDLLAEV